MFWMGVLLVCGKLWLENSDHQVIYAPPPPFLLFLIAEHIICVTHTERFLNSHTVKHLI